MREANFRNGTAGRFVVTLLCGMSNLQVIRYLHRIGPMDRSKALEKLHRVVGTVQWSRCPTGFSS